MIIVVCDQGRIIVEALEARASGPPTCPKTRIRGDPYVWGAPEGLPKKWGGPQQRGTLLSGGPQGLLCLGAPNPHDPALCVTCRIHIAGTGDRVKSRIDLLEPYLSDTDQIIQTFWKKIGEKS